MGEAKAHSKLPRWAVLSFTVVIGAALTAFAYRFNMLLGTFVLLLWLFLIVLYSPTNMRPFLWLEYGVALVGVPVGEIVHAFLESYRIEGTVPWTIVSQAISIITGIAAGISATFVFCAAVLSVAEKYVLAFDREPMMDPRQARKYLVRLLLGRHQTWMIIGEGKVIQTYPPGLLARFGGPGVVVIKPGNAAVFEWGGKVSQILGPGIHQLRRFEVLKKVVDLRPQFMEVLAKEVLTKDRVPLDITLGISYQIESKEETEKREGLLDSPVIGEVYKVYAEIVRRAVYNVSANGWEVAPSVAVISCLRDVVRRYYFDEILGLRHFLTEGQSRAEPKQEIIESEIEGEVIARLVTLPETLGIKIIGVRIKQINMPPEVSRLVMDIWREGVAKRLGVQSIRSAVERELPGEKAYGQLEPKDVVISSDVGKIDHEVAFLQRLRSIRKQNLLWLEEQRALYGLYAPLSLLHQIEHEKEELAKIDRQLKRFHSTM